jgi:hypothetical protein
VALVALIVFELEKGVLAHSYNEVVMWRRYTCFGVRGLLIV